MLKVTLTFPPLYAPYFRFAWLRSLAFPRVLQASFIATSSPILFFWRKTGKSSSLISVFALKFHPICLNGSRSSARLTGWRRRSYQGEQNGKTSFGIYGIKLNSFGVLLDCSYLIPGGVHIVPFPSEMRGISNGLGRKWMGGEKKHGWGKKKRLIDKREKKKKGEKKSMSGGGFMLVPRFLPSKVWFITILPFANLSINV